MTKAIHKSVFPDCPWCSAANTLELEWSEMGTDYCRCTCCSKRCRVDRHNLAHRFEAWTPALDVRDGDMYDDG